MPYLDPVETRLYFENLSLCLPHLDRLESFIPIVETLMDTWLGKHLGATEYSEVRQTNYQGTIVLRNYPVISLISVEMVDRTIIQGGEMTVVDQLDPYSIWDGDLTLHTGNCDCARFSYLIRYIAGYNPLPPVVGAVAKLILEEILRNGSPTALFETPKEIVEAQNPTVGGTFKQKFQRGTTSGSILDRYMQPLVKYKSHLRLG